MTLFFKEFIIYKPDNNKIDEKIIVDKLINCEINCFHTFKFECICDDKLKDIRNKKN